MMDKKKIYYSTPGLLTVIIFASNFLSTDLFKAGYQNFSVWFVLSVFAFACGWLINKTLGYNHGGKIVFSVIVASAFVSILMISLFSEYFGLSALLVENMILYILRNITLGSMAFSNQTAGFSPRNTAFKQFTSAGLKNFFSISFCGIAP